MYNVNFKFETEEQADQFLTWLSNSGEQDYWNAMDGEELINKISYRLALGVSSKTSVILTK